MIFDLNSLKACICLEYFRLNLGTIHRKVKPSKKSKHLISSLLIPISFNYFWLLVRSPRYQNVRPSQTCLNFHLSLSGLRSRSTDGA